MVMMYFPKLSMPKNHDRLLFVKNNALCHFRPFSDCTFDVWSRLTEEWARSQQDQDTIIPDGATENEIASLLGITAGICHRQSISIKCLARMLHIRV